LNLDAGRSVDKSLQYFLFVVVEKSAHAQRGESRKTMLVGQHE